MTPEELLWFAQELGASEFEVRRRASVSRAYYAAFHHLQSIVEERVGLPRFGTAEDHRDVLVALRDLDADIAEDFAYLRRMRVRSAYDLDLDVSPAVAATCHGKAVTALGFS